MPSGCFVNQYGISLLYGNEVIQYPAEQTGISIATKRSVCLSDWLPVVAFFLCLMECAVLRLFHKTKLANRKIANKPWSRRLGHWISLLQIHTSIEKVIDPIDHLINAYLANISTEIGDNTQGTRNPGCIQNIFSSKKVTSSSICRRYPVLISACAPSYISLLVILHCHT